MSNSFVQRAINVSLSIGSGPNGNFSPKVYTYTGLKISAEIDIAGNLTPPAASITIYGMPPSDMNALTSLGQADGRLRNNSVTVTAGNVGEVMSTVFTGNVLESYGQFQGAPEVGFQITSLTGGLALLQHIPPTTYSGPVDAALILSGIASQMGFQFENSGASAILASPYFAGTAYDQASACAKAAKFDIDISNNTLAIWPRNGRRNKPIPLISPDTGMIGYPEYASNGIALKTLYNPAVFPGGFVQVESSITPACGMWKIYTISHALESQTKNGQWSSTIYAVNPNFDLGI